MSSALDVADSDNGRPGVPPERLIKALVLAIYSIRSEGRLVGTHRS